MMYYVKARLYMSHMYNNTVEGVSELLVGRPRCEATAISKGLFTLQRTYYTGF
jgi:hypothetical protein